MHHMLEGVAQSEIYSELYIIILSLSFCVNIFIRNVFLMKTVSNMCSTTDSWTKNVIQLTET